jgi:hypothetical protein
MAKMAKDSFSRAAIEETEYLIKITRAEVQEGRSGVSISWAQKG